MPDAHAGEGLLVNTSKPTHRTKAAFWIDDSHGWRWRTWDNSNASRHAAILEKAIELGAKGYDSGNSEHEELSRWNHATQG
jgi:hypothetical protein